MDDVEVPEYFICPISLQIMKDPVTTVTGITFDRESIEHWLLTSRNTSCPVTKQSLFEDSYLTPNVTLRRLIQAWCTENASLGIDRIPIPRPRLDKFHVRKLLKDLEHDQLQAKTLRKLELLAAANKRNRDCMVEAGVPLVMLSFITACYSKGQTAGLREALSILGFVRIPSKDSKAVMMEDEQIITSLTWVLGCNMDDYAPVHSHAVSVLKILLQEANPSVLERLRSDFFERITSIFRVKTTYQGVNAALQVMLDACPWGRNRLMMIESGAIYELVELELGSPEKRTSELILAILFHLCSSANGRAQLLSHKGSLAVIAKRILTISPAADDLAVLILGLVCKFSGTNVVLQEMVDVHAVTKLCLLLQVECTTYLKAKAREILRSYSYEWKNSPCIVASHFTNFYPN